MFEYRHFVQYYETDRMGIVHHSNYLRWMEEARVAYLEELGWGYDKIEAKGLVCPVTAASCKYRASTTFSDVVTVKVAVEEYRGLILKIKYEMTKQDGQRVFEGRSEHCYLDMDKNIVRLKEKLPELDELYRSLVE